VLLRFAKQFEVPNFYFLVQKTQTLLGLLCRVIADQVVREARLEYTFRTMPLYFIGAGLIRGGAWRSRLCFGFHALGIRRLRRIPADRVDVEGCLSAAKLYCPACRFHRFDRALPGEGGCTGGMRFGPDQPPGTVLASELTQDAIGAVVAQPAGLAVTGRADVETALRILQVCRPRTLAPPREAKLPPEAGLVSPSH
jgi:hypothetical protein